ncbi:RING/U-box superfamily protein [Actinidia rufa]|uniref:RING/U-box superfamily protein n=1 Tax=Actinidia rufa TaxID=165716 RepID=A0A7J0DQB1_9ERIC|nr:RING/U-box superfamily protein [Actinidia rufa]
MDSSSINLNNNHTHNSLNLRTSLPPTNLNRSNPFRSRRPTIVQVNESGKPKVKKFVAHQNNVTKSHCNAVAQGGAGSAQRREKLSGTVSPHGQRTSSSINCQASATQSGGRKTQMKGHISDLDSWLARADSGLVDDLEKLPYVCAAMEQLEQRRKNWNEQQICHGNVAHKCNDSQTEPEGSPPIADRTDVGHEPCKFVWGSLSSSDDGKSKWVGDTTPDKLDGEVCLDPIADVIEPLEGQECALSSSYDDSKSVHRNFGGFRDIKEESCKFYQVLLCMVIYL